MEIVYTVVSIAKRVQGADVLQTFTLNPVTEGIGGSFVIEALNPDQQIDLGDRLTVAFQDVEKASLAEAIPLGEVRKTVEPAPEPVLEPDALGR